MQLKAVPLDPAAFAPFGDVLLAPAGKGRTHYDENLESRRAHAHPSLYVASVKPTPGPMITATVLERHEFSSQTFVPMEIGRWLILVAPHAASGGPDMTRAQAFIATAGQGVTYRPDTWHHGLTVLDVPAKVAIFMWSDGTATDTEFVTVPALTIDCSASVVSS